MPEINVLFKLVNENSITTELILGRLNTRYTPSTDESKYRIIIKSPMDNPVVNPENCAILVPLRLSVNCVNRPGTCTH